MSEYENRDEEGMEKEIEKAEGTVEEKDDSEYEKVCFLCHRPESVAGKMIELPNNVCVCRDCMQKSFDAMTSGQIDYSQLMNNLQIGRAHV